MYNSYPHAWLSAVVGYNQEVKQTEALVSEWDVPLSYIWYLKRAICKHVLKVYLYCMVFVLLLGFCTMFVKAHFLCLSVSFHAPRLSATVAFAFFHCLHADCYPQIPGLLLRIWRRILLLGHFLWFFLDAYSVARIAQLCTCVILEQCDCDSFQITTLASWLLKQLATWMWFLESYNVLNSVTHSKFALTVEWPASAKANGSIGKHTLHKTNCGS